MFVEKILVIEIIKMKLVDVNYHQTSYTIYLLVIVRNNVVLVQIMPRFQCLDIIVKALCLDPRQCLPNIVNIFVVV